MRNIMIVLSTTIGFDFIVTEMVHATVVDETEKALKVNLLNSEKNIKTSYNIWLPKKALKNHIKDEPDIFKLQKWFKPSYFVDRALQNCKGMYSNSY